MVTKRELDTIRKKLRRLEEDLEGRLFIPVMKLEESFFETDEKGCHIPPEEQFVPVRDGFLWGEEGKTGWFRSVVTVPPAADGKDLFLRSHAGGYETLLWVDGQPFGTYANKIIYTNHGNHYCCMIAKNAQSGQKIRIALEVYAGHYIVGWSPLRSNSHLDYPICYHASELCVKNEAIYSFYFKLKTFNELYASLDSRSDRKGRLESAMIRLHQVLYYSFEDTPEEIFYQALGEAEIILSNILSVRNSESALYAGLVGHSHIDTAWLWDEEETIRKCARTFSNQLNFMEQYPEYRFIQSALYHSELIRRHYPGLFERIRKAVSKGTYEINGGLYVECDCNLVSGESLVRQFLWGQRYAKKYFGKYSDCCWLPDTFGYSAALPQIMRSCHVPYFVTTKMSWNDTNRFPFDTFYWKGIDGSLVFCHLARMDVWPSPENIIKYVSSGETPDSIQQKYISHGKLLAYGFGDGGGGPQFEMIEVARLCRDLDGCPKTEHTSVSQFMKKLQEESTDPAVYTGELYLELHRGTLTTQHEIKRNNRLAEIALHDLDFLAVVSALAQSREATDESYRSWQEMLLVNQFHDILPGTCITAAHKKAKSEVSRVISNAKKWEENVFPHETGRHLLVNTTSFLREDVLYLDFIPRTENLEQTICVQKTETLLGGEQYAVKGLVLPPLSVTAVLADEECPTCSTKPFFWSNNCLETPFYAVAFDKKMRIISMVDKRVQRELCAEPYPWNTFLVAEDVPADWDNWDIDLDVQHKFKDDSILLDSHIISSGVVEFRIRNRYQIGAKSFLIQDIVFFAEDPMVKFETRMEWHEHHKLLKAVFPTTIHSDFAANEIQFGYIHRPTSRNNSYETAKFEVCNHKYTDISEPKYGIAMLNDCKYGISVEQGCIGLTLHKGGNRPDTEGDLGVHYCEYAILPHLTAFSAESVIKYGYLFNYRPIALKNRQFDTCQTVVTANPNIVIETIKPCEDKQKAYIMRLYEAEGSYTNTTIAWKHEVHSIWQATMLEEEEACLSIGKTELALSFQPFEIKTLKVVYGS